MDSQSTKKFNLTGTFFILSIYKLNYSRKKHIILLYTLIQTNNSIIYTYLLILINSFCISNTNYYYTLN